VVLSWVLIGYLCKMFYSITTMFYINELKFIWCFLFLLFFIFYCNYEFNLLQLRTYFTIDEEITYWLPRCSHNHLKEITITGIRGHSSEIAIAIYLLRNANSLEKMIVDPRPRIYLENGKCVHSEACDYWRMIGRYKVEFLLKQEISSLVELSIL